MAQWINLNWNNRSVLAHDILYCEKNWPYPPTASGSYGRLADEIQVGFKILKIFYRLKGQCIGIV